MADIYPDSTHLLIKSPCKKRFSSPLSQQDSGLEWKAEGEIDGESEGGDCEEVTSAGWGEPGGQWQNEVDGVKKGADSTGKVMHMWKTYWRLVMRKIEMVDSS